MKGPLLLMAGIGLFGLLDANSKILSADYGVAQALVIRHATLLLLLFGLRALWRGAGGRLRTEHPRMHALRATAMLFSGVCFFLGFRHLPLAVGYLVFFTAPFLTLVMASVFLREAVPRAAWIWCGVGFAGVVLALVPQIGTGDANLIGLLYLLGGTLCYAINITVNRGLRGEPGLARLILWPSLLGIFATTPFAAEGWVAPDAEAWARLIANGIFAGAAALCLALAFRHAAASRLAPFEFVALPWAVVLDLVIFGDPPAASVLAGGAVVIMACVMSERAIRASVRGR